MAAGKATRGMITAAALILMTAPATWSLHSGAEELSPQALRGLVQHDASPLRPKFYTPSASAAV
jgi:hypothetical protein